jgi:dTDP-4-dehydrorhamnose 3,5-epimerase
MKFLPLEVEGAFLIEIEPVKDDRGYFAKTFSAEDFRASGLDMAVTQSGSSFSPVKGTLRGLHFQRAPHGEAKLVRCVRGAVHDVAVDMRPGSPTEGRSIAVELTGHDFRQLYLPHGLAHGFLTLEENTEITYLMTGHYVPEAATGARWDDPAFGITWPAEPKLISQRDREWPLTTR